GQAGSRDLRQWLRAGRVGEWLTPDARRSRLETRGSAGAETRLGVRAALPAGLLQHLAVLVLPHLLAPLLDDRTQANSCTCLIDQLGLTQPPRTGRNDSAERRMRGSGIRMSAHTIGGNALHRRARGAPPARPP